MLFLCKEVPIAILENDLNLHSNREKKHRHVKYSEYALPCVLTLKFPRNLCNLDKEELLVIRIKFERIQSVSKHVPIDEVSNKTYHASKLFLPEVFLNGL